MVVNGGKGAAVCAYCAAHLTSQTAYCRDDVTVVSGKDPQSMLASLGLG